MSDFMGIDVPEINIDPLSSVIDKAISLFEVWDRISHEVPHDELHTAMRDLRKALISKQGENL